MLNDSKHETKKTRPVIAVLKIGEEIKLSAKQILNKNRLLLKRKEQKYILEYSMLRKSC